MITYWNQNHDVGDCTFQQGELSLFCITSRSRDRKRLRNIFISHFDDVKYFYMRSRTKGIMSDFS